jgi:hypothetical protein
MFYGTNKLRKIVFTNMTPNFKKVLDEYDKKESNYESIFLEKEENFLTNSLLEQNIASLI